MSDIIGLVRWLVIEASARCLLRVQHLRNTYPNNEVAFRQALERQVLAAHEKAKASAAQQQSATIASGSGAASPHAAVGQAQDAGQSRAFAAGRSYPGQQHAPQTVSTSNTASPSVNLQQNPQSSSYIPYARDTVPQGRPPGSSTRRHQPQPSTSSREQLSGSIASGPQTSVAAGAAPMRSAPMPRQTNPSAFNNAAAPLRQPRIQPVPAIQSREPLPPYFPISTSQAYMTSYPSRLKLGLTSLVQPISSSGQVISANPRAINSTASRAAQVSSSTSTLGKRQRAKVDYTERLRIDRPESSEEEDESSDDDENENETQEDARLSRAQRAAKRSGMPVPSSVSTPRDSPAPEHAFSRKRKEKNRDDIGGGGRTWLGQDPPGDLIMVQPAKRHILPYV